MAETETNGQVIEIGFTMHLLDDLRRSIEGMQTPGKDQQFWRRTAFRSLFGFLEAWISVNRRYMIPDMLRDHHDALITSVDDAAYVQALIKATDPVEYVLTDKGEGRAQNRKMKFLPQFKAIVRLVMCVSGIAREEVDRQFGNAAWAEIGKAIKVRDRITHPQFHEDAVITDDDIKSLYAVREWLHAFLSNVNYPESPARFDDGEDDATGGVAQDALDESADAPGHT
jgi:hypothetical protein